MAFIQLLNCVPLYKKNYVTFTSVGKFRIVKEKDITPVVMYFMYCFDEIKDSSNFV